MTSVDIGVKYHGFDEFHSSTSVRNSVSILVSGGVSSARKRYVSIFAKMKTILFAQASSSLS